MRYFRNRELISLYGVSDKAVRNWIQAAAHGRLPLEIYTHTNGKSYIADTLHNSEILSEVVRRGRKYRNRNSHRSVKPKPDFYRLYSREQIVDIASTLDVTHEFPYRLRYCGAAGDYWDSYLQKLLNAAENNLLKNSIQTIDHSFSYLSSLITAPYINIIDLQVANGRASKELVAKLHATGKLLSYIGIDYSQRLLQITEGNVKNFFGKDLKFKAYCMDVSTQQVRNILAKNAQPYMVKEVQNIALLLGGTIMNYPDPLLTLKQIKQSLNVDDILICSLKLDSIKARRFFDFNTVHDASELPFHNRYSLDLLGIEPEFYDVEQFYSDELRSRIVRIRFKTNLSLAFHVGEYLHNVDFKKGDTVTLLKIRHYGEDEIIELFREGGFQNMQITKSSDSEYITLISKLDTERLSS